MKPISFVLNGNSVSLDLDPSLRLLDVLREHLNLTGTKEGCGEGECGACAVLLDGHIINSCCFPLAHAQGHHIVTIEGFKTSQRFEIISEAIKISGGSQCGICTPGMVIAAESLLNQNPHPTEIDIRIGLSGNLCRCTGYNMIIEAIKLAAKKGEGLW